MAEYKTKYAIGDLVYTASARDIDREVIKSIRITGLKGKIEYGFKRPSSNAYSMWGLFGDGDTWYKSSEVFEDKESALSLHKSLEAKAEAEKAKEDLKRRAERKAALLEELEDLER